MSEANSSEKKVSSGSFYGSKKSDYLSPSERKRLRALSFSARTPSSFESVDSEKKPPRKVRKKLTHKRKKENEPAVDVVLPVRNSPQRNLESNKFFKNLLPTRNAAVRFTPKRGLKFA